VDKATLVALLRETATESAKAAKTLATAVSKSSSKSAERDALREGVPTLLRHELRTLETALFAKHGVARGDVEEALLYYTGKSVAGDAARDKEMAAATAAGKKAVGVSLLTPRRCIELIVGFHEHQIAQMEGMLEELLAEHDPQSQAFQEGIMRGSQRIVNEYVVEESGLEGGVSELVAAARDFATRDPEFGKALGSCLSTQSERVQAKVQELLASKGVH